MSACEKLPSMYGMAGWTLELGVRDLLADYLSAFGDTSFHRFADIPADLVAELIARVPTANLEDRQNSALTLGVLAAAALSRPEQVLLSGYVVGPPRHDERVSVDGVTILRTPIRALGGWGVEPAGEERMRIWRALGEYLGWEATEENCPDEIIPILEASVMGEEGVHESQGWWVWWD